MPHVLTLAPDPASVSVARAFAAEVLTPEVADTDIVDVAVLLVSELVTNAVVHAGTPVVLAISPPDTGTAPRDGYLRVEVTDSSAALPELRAHGLESLDGRGLEIVSMLASSCGVESTREGKTVWFSLETTQLSQSTPPARSTAACG